MPLVWNDDDKLCQEIHHDWSKHHDKVEADVLYLFWVCACGATQVTGHPLVNPAQPDAPPDPPPKGKIELG